MVNSCVNNLERLRPLISFHRIGREIRTLPLVEAEATPGRSWGTTGRRCSRDRGALSFVSSFGERNKTVGRYLEAYPVLIKKLLSRFSNLIDHGYPSLCNPDSGLQTIDIRLKKNKNTWHFVGFCLMSEVYRLDCPVYVGSNTVLPATQTLIVLSIRAADGPGITMDDAQQNYG